MAGAQNRRIIAQNRPTWLVHVLHPTRVLHRTTIVLLYLISTAWVRSIVSSPSWVRWVQVGGPTTRKRKPILHLLRRCRMRWRARDNVKRNGSRQANLYASKPVSRKKANPYHLTFWVGILSWVQSPVKLTCKGASSAASAAVALHWPCSGAEQAIVH
jgi:hypothetical protein